MPLWHSTTGSRMQSWPLLLSSHTKKIWYRKSELHANADGLSQLPLPVKHVKRHQADIFYFRQVKEAPITSSQVKRNINKNDPVLSKVMDIVMNGGSNTLPEWQHYNKKMNELSVQVGCLMWGRRVIVPPTLQKTLLKQLHSGHCGMVRMKELTRSYSWWPVLDGQIEETGRTCPSCQEIGNMPQPAPLHPWDWLEKPWR